MAGCDDVFSPPSFDPFIGINFPACMIKDRINGHNHEQRQSRADMDGNKERHDGEQPRRADGFNRVERKARPRRGLYGTVMAFVSPFKEFAVMHDAVREIKPSILRE